MVTVVSRPWGDARINSNKRLWMIKINGVLLCNGIAMNKDSAEQQVKAVLKLIIATQ